MRGPKGSQSGNLGLARPVPSRYRARGGMVGVLSSDARIHTIPRPWPGYCVLGGLLAFTVCAVQLADARTRRPPVTRDSVGLGVGYRPPEFSALDLNGQRHSLSDYRGRVVVLHFWASWCPYCRGEIEELVRLHREWASKGVRVLTISTDESVEQLKQFIAKAGLPYPVIADLETDPSVAEQYGIGGIPVTLIVGADGHIAARLEGSSDIIGEVQRVLAASPAPAA